MYSGDGLPSPGVGFLFKQGPGVFWFTAKGTHKMLETKKMMNFGFML